MYCNRTQTIQLGDGYSLMMFMGTPTPKARSFELPGDSVHYAPDRPADIQHVKLTLDLDFEQEMVHGTASTTFMALYEEIRTITLDAIALQIEKVALADGRTLEYSQTDKQLFITLDRSYRHGEELTIDITYQARPRTGLHFVKPAPEDPTRPVQVFTFGQPRYHAHWFPCHDSPNDRATTEMIVTVPADLQTVANGLLLSTTDNGATKTYHWRHDIPHAMYLVSLVVGDFAVVEDTYKGKPVTYYVRKDRKDDAPLYMGKTPQMMEFFSEYTGVEYPYDHYAQTVVEVFTGAMEHTTATTHGFTLLLDKRASLDLGPEFVSVVAHELAHQWFGDLVTCRDWSNGWLNEGFATYFENLWNEHDLGNDFFKHSMLELRAGYQDEDARYRRPVVYHVYHDGGFELFDAHLYNKAGWILHMLRHQLGEATFRRAVKAYLERYREKEVITADLERTLEDVTGRSMAQFFQQWIYSGGYPAFEVNYSWDTEQKLAKIKIKQTQKIDDLTPCFVTPVDLAFTVPSPDKDEETQVVSMRVLVGEDGQIEQSFYFPLEREPLMVRFDPDGWLLKTLKFERSAQMLQYQLKHDPDVLGRIEAAEGLGDKDELDGVGALGVALNHDPFWGVRSAAAASLGKLGTDLAQGFLLRALESLDATQFSRVRAVVATALGKFQAPQQEEKARESAQALQKILEAGDISYRVEYASAEALGKTRVEGNVDLLTKLIERPSWLNYVQRGIFSGLAATGEDRVVDIMVGYLLNANNHPTLRRGAAMGLGHVGRQRHLYSQAAREQAVTALCIAVEHDTWKPVCSAAANALMALREKRAIQVLERQAAQELDSGAQRHMRMAAYVLRTTDESQEQVKQLRKDLEELREENRKLKDQLSDLEARIK